MTILWNLFAFALLVLVLVLLFGLHYLQLQTSGTVCLRWFPHSSHSNPVIVPGERGPIRLMAVKRSQSYCMRLRQGVVVPSTNMADCLPFSTSSWFR